MKLMRTKYLPAAGSCAHTIVSSCQVDGAGDRSTEDFQFTAVHFSSSMPRQREEKRLKSNGKCTLWAENKGFKLPPSSVYIYWFRPSEKRTLCD